MLKKTILLTFSTCLSLNVQAAKLINSYELAEKALSEGQRLTIWVDWEKCQSNYPDIKLDYQSSWTPEGIVVHKGDYIGARGESYTQRLKMRPDLGSMVHVFEYVIHKDQNLQITNWFIDPITRAEKLPAAHLECKMNEGFLLYGRD